MTPDHAVALSLLENLSRVGLTERLKNDPALLLLASDRLEPARTVRERAERDGVHVVPWNDPRFPVALATLTDLPPVLWCRGQLSAVDAPSVAIVGSRAASAAAVETAGRLGADLAARGFTVVSGLARGVDSAAHRGALRHGRTVAVLGSGVDRIYPPEHASLAEQVEQSGLLVSEYPPGTAPLPFHFPMRNRLISGLSLAVVVIEASEKSGSLITAACALEQGRDVMVVPGSVLNGRNRGGHALLRDGAKIVETADDIVEELGWAGYGEAIRSFRLTDCGSAVSGDPVLRIMEPGQPYELEDLATGSGLDASRLLPRLLDLELRGFVRRAGGGRFLRPL